MKKIKFSDVVPHAVAILVFLVVTLAFFSPVFFENKVLSQSDIAQHSAVTKDLYDYREATGEEGLWATRIFGGMPAYLVSVDWSDEAVIGIKKALSLFLTHPVCNIYLCFICYYILLLSFRIRPYLAIAGALAFGLSSYMMIGLSAGHNARIGAIAFMPLVMAGIHLSFTGKRVLGFGVTAAGLALHLREQHPQITYYLLIIVLLYGLVQLIYFVREKQLSHLFKILGGLAAAAVVAALTYFGQLWAISEFTPYSYRGTSELVNTTTKKSESGLSKGYAFQYSYGIAEPMTLFIPNFLGGSSSDYLIRNESSNTYKALVGAGDQQLANQLAQASSAYWGSQPLSAPYYAGAVTFFLFVLGIFWAEKKYRIWLITASVLSIFLCLGSTFSAFNYFIFDYLPGYNKLRSVTFALIIMLFSMPLLGLLGLEQLLQEGWSKVNQKKLIWTSALTVGLCLLLALTGGFADFLKPGEARFPAWFRSALQKDRMELLQSDAWRSFWFMLAFAAALLACMKKWIKEWVLMISLILLMVIDLPLVDRRFISKERFERKRGAAPFQMMDSEKELIKDTKPFRVYTGRGDGASSYYFRATGGYSGARLHRYEELMDSCLGPEMDAMVGQFNSTGKLFLPQHSVMSMMNVKYFINGDKKTDFFVNEFANGEAWFVKDVQVVNSANEELDKIKEINTLTTAVVDGTKFKLSKTSYDKDSVSFIRQLELKPPYVKYESQSASDGLAVFSEIYYPKGWHAKIDGKEVPILRANYVLRALEVPAGTHVIEFSFEPKPYLIGNKITMVSSWILLILVAGSLGLGTGTRTS